MAKELQLGREVLEQPSQIRVASGATLLVQTRVRVLLQMGDQKFAITLLVADIGSAFVLGMTFMHNPIINWLDMTLTFQSSRGVV